MPVWLFFASTFASAFGCYLLLAGSATATELGAAFGVACATAAFMTVQRIRQHRLVALRCPTLAVLVHVLASLATDAARVGAALARALVRPVSGSATWQAFHPGGIAPADAGRRALVNLLTSLAPNGFVLDIRPSTRKEAGHALLLHRLAPAPPLSGKDWPA